MEKRVSRRQTIRLPPMQLFIIKEVKTSTPRFVNAPRHLIIDPDQIYPVREFCSIPAFPTGLPSLFARQPPVPTLINSIDQSLIKISRLDHRNAVSETDPPAQKHGSPAFTDRDDGAHCQQQNREMIANVVGNT